MRGHNHMAGSNDALIDYDARRLVSDNATVRENMGPFARNGPGEPSHIFGGMKLRLIVETDGGEDIKREASVNRQGRRKAQSLRDLRLLSNSGDVFFFTRISVGSFGLDIALYIVLRGKAPDAGNRGIMDFGIDRKSNRLNSS